MTLRVPGGGRLTVLIGLALVALAPAAPAVAHTRLTATSPADGATVPASTDQLVLSFTDPVRADLARVQVTGPDGAVAPGSVSGSGTEVVQQLQAPLSTGDWTAAYRVLSPDGHPISGTFAFTVAGTAPSTSTTAPASTPTGQPPTAEPSTAPAADAQGAADHPSALSVALGVLVIGAVGASVVVLRRRRSSGTPAGL